MYVSYVKVVNMTDRAVWTEDSISSFIKAMVAEVGRGCWVDSGFKKDGWKRIVDALHLLLDLKYTKQQCQSKYKSLKEKYTITRLLWTTRVLVLIRGRMHLQLQNQSGML